MNNQLLPTCVPVSRQHATPQVVDGVLLSGLVEFADLAHRREYAQAALRSGCSVLESQESVRSPVIFF